MSRSGHRSLRRRARTPAREAFTEHLVGAVHRGLVGRPDATVADSFVPLGAQFNNPENPSRQYDLERASALLPEAGVGSLSRDRQFGLS